MNVEPENIVFESGVYQSLTWGKLSQLSEALPNYLSNGTNVTGLYHMTIVKIKGEVGQNALICL
jgi:hypothetical protein